jgi:2-hydroxychromene-2-carboxylate isomerase
MNLASGKVDAEQPIMTRLMALAVGAVAMGRGLAFARYVSHRIWQGVENWNQEGALAEASKAAGLNWTALEDWTQANAPTIARVVQENETEQLKHHWGVPLMVLDHEPFFGQDRLDSLIWRLDQRHLKRRQSA